MIHMFKSNIWKKILSDIALNTMAFGSVIVVQQIVVYPILAQGLSTDQFGNLLTYIAIANIVASSLGSELGNTRLIMDEKYKISNLNGDFKLLLIINACLSLVLIFVSTVLLSGIIVGFYEKLIMACIGVLGVIRLYIAAEYRVDGNFKKILFQNILYVIGVLVGLGLYLWTKKIYVVFLCAECLSVVYSYRGSRISKDRVITTPLLKESLVIFKNLSLTTGITYVTSQLDKLAINPILGASNVSTYYSAGVAGKVGSLVLAPINGVLLSWIGKIKKDKKEIYIGMISISFAIGVLYYFVARIISPILIQMLYPQYYIETQNIINGVCVVCSLDVAISLIKVTLMRLGETNKIMRIYLMFSGIYLISCVILMLQLGLMGFVVANILSKIILLTLLCLQMKKEIIL